MNPAIDMAGCRCGRLTVLSRAGSRYGRAAWLCRCDCGKEKVISGPHLRRGTSSCGCISGNPRLHGFARKSERHPEYALWKAMRQRCSNPDNKNYADYGGRGITICERWHDFATFIADMGPRPSTRHTIERRDNSKGYQPDNCYWLLREAQPLNSRRVRRFQVNGETLTIKQIASIVGLSYSRTAERLRSGDTAESLMWGRNATH